MFNWLGGNKDGSDVPGTQNQHNAVIRVVGDRSAGKTTYMAALARWPNANPSSPVQAITPINEDGRRLIDKAQLLLEDGLEIEPDRLQQVDDLLDYSLQIVLKDQFSWAKVRGDHALVTLNLSCKDYSGEFFRDILASTADPTLDDYIDDCQQADGLLLLVDGTNRRRDEVCTRGLNRLFMALDQVDLVGNTQRRVALVLTKCEQPELWVKRLEPKTLAAQRFPQLYQRLQSWQQTGSGQVDVFTNSAFGMLGQQYPQPNAKRATRTADGVKWVLQTPRLWRPFGMVAPIYWLCTGKRHPALEDD